MTSSLFIVSIALWRYLKDRAQTHLPGPNTEVSFASPDCVIPRQLFISLSWFWKSQVFIDWSLYASTDCRQKLVSVPLNTEALLSEVITRASSTNRFLLLSFHGTLSPCDCKSIHSLIYLLILSSKPLPSSTLLPYHGPAFSWSCSLLHLSEGFACLPYTRIHFAAWYFLGL